VSGKGDLVSELLGGKVFVIATWGLWNQERIRSHVLTCPIESARGKDRSSGF